MGNLSNYSTKKAIPAWVTTPENCNLTAACQLSDSHIAQESSVLRDYFRLM